MYQKTLVQSQIAARTTNWKYVSLLKDNSPKPLTSSSFDQLQNSSYHFLPGKIQGAYHTALETELEQKMQSQQHFLQVMVAEKAQVAEMESKQVLMQHQSQEVTLAKYVLADCSYNSSRSKTVVYAPVPLKIHIMQTNGKDNW